VAAAAEEEKEADFVFNVLLDKSLAFLTRDTTRHIFFSLFVPFSVIFYSFKEAG